MPFTIPYEYFHKVKRISIFLLSIFYMIMKYSVFYIITSFDNTSIAQFKSATVVLRCLLPEIADEVARGAGTRLRLKFTRWSHIGYGTGQWQGGRGLV